MTIRPEDLAFLNELQYFFVLVIVVCVLYLPFVLWDAYKSHKEYGEIEANNNRIEQEYWKNKRQSK